MDSLEIISASRHAADRFWQDTALGQSIRRLSPDPRLSYRISCSNTLGLPEVYNACLQQDKGADIKVFMHDDVWLDDCYFIDRIVEGLKHYDVIGVAGNKRRLPGQPGWACLSLKGNKLVMEDYAWLSGTIGHGQQPFGKLARFGPVPAECEMLDGVLLAARRSVLLQKQVAFDPRFDFHFYDLDFCRSARSQGLRLGVWPIALTHQSRGMIGNALWRRNYQHYLQKWQEESHCSVE